MNVCVCVCVCVCEDKLAAGARLALLAARNGRSRSSRGRWHARERTSAHGLAMAGLDDARLAQDVFVVFLGLSLAFVSIARPSSARSLARSARDAAPLVVVPLCLARAALASVQSLLLGNACLLVLWVALAATEHDYYVSYVHTLCVHLIPPVMTLSVLLAGVFFALPSIPRALHDLGTLLLGRPSYAFAPYVVLCLRRRAAVWRARPSQASRPVVIAFSPSSGWSSVPADSVPSRARARTRTRTREPAHAANAWQDEGHER